jgi:hypothetical protein
MVGLLVSINTPCAGYFREGKAFAEPFGLLLARSLFFLIISLFPKLITKAQQELRSPSAINLHSAMIGRVSLLANHSSGNEDWTPGI